MLDTTPDIKEAQKSETAETEASQVWREAQEEICATGSAEPGLRFVIAQDLKSTQTCTLPPLAKSSRRKTTDAHRSHRFGFVQGPRETGRMHTPPTREPIASVGKREGKRGGRRGRGAEPPAIVYILKRYDSLDGQILGKTED